VYDAAHDAPLLSAYHRALITAIDPAINAPIASAKYAAVDAAYGVA
jgi:hypothetical protein